MRSLYQRLLYVLICIACSIIQCKCKAKMKQNISEIRWTLQIQTLIGHPQKTRRQAVYQSCGELSFQLPSVLPSSLWRNSECEIFCVECNIFGRFTTLMELVHQIAVLLFVTLCIPGDRFKYFAEIYWFLLQITSIVKKEA